jgi:hypothetical protein
MRAELLEPTSQRWTDLLVGMPHDFYHLPSYVRFAARHQDVGQPLAFAAEEGGHRFLVPLIVRSIPAELASDRRSLFDASCPRGYPGPLVALAPGRDAGDFVDRAIETFVGTLRQRSIVSAFVRLHPLLLPPMPPLLRAGPVIEHGLSTSIDLTLSRAELWHQTNHGHRSRISRAIRLGYVARIDESWGKFDALVDVYQQSMERVGAEPFWRLSHEYFRDLRESLRDRLFLCVVEIGDDVAAAALLTETDGIVEFHLSGTADAFVRASPTKLLVSFAASWAKDRGNRSLHLAGSLRPGDSLRQFKAGFSPLHHPVCTWRVISDPTAYGELLKRWEAFHEATADPPDGYFPAFRKPDSRLG